MQFTTSQYRFSFQTYNKGLKISSQKDIEEVLGTIDLAECVMSCD